MFTSSVRRVASASHRLVRSSLLPLVLLCVAPLGAEAQVGHRPSTSPYEDVKLGQSLSLSGGWLATKRDPAGVAPDAAFMAQVRYDVAIGGPAILFARYSLSPSQRLQYAPGAVASARKVGTPGVVTHIVDGGLDIVLTGRKTWHRLMPSVGGGVGIVSDYANADSGSYQFGVKFAISYGAGVRYVHGNGLRFRLDANNYLWQYEYPDRYFVKATDGTSILTDTRQRTSWRGNWALTAGASYPIFR